MAAKGVRISCETLATKSLRTCSRRSRSDKALIVFGVLQPAVEQGIGIPDDGRQGGAHFVRNVGDEVLADLFEALQIGQGSDCFRRPPARRRAGYRHTRRWPPRGCAFRAKRWRRSPCGPVRGAPDRTRL